MLGKRERPRHLGPNASRQTSPLYGSQPSGVSFPLPPWIHNSHGLGPLALMVVGQMRNGTETPSSSLNVWSEKGMGHGEVGMVLVVILLSDY